MSAELARYRETQKFWRCLFRDPGPQVKRVAVAIAMRDWQEQEAMARELQQEGDPILQQIGVSLEAICNGAACVGNPAGHGSWREIARKKKGAIFDQQKDPRYQPQARGDRRRRTGPTARDLADENFWRSTDWPRMMMVLKNLTCKTYVDIGRECGVASANMSDYASGRSLPNAANSKLLIDYAAAHGIERIHLEARSDPEE